ncbi:hypothetical protein HETIRDRAFT_331884 [Heterobasidion irregulare TC 32-1]|uniref:NADP-dependent oxidoreductase domain-containing protein n=1 Tax=Heterobasidion irregulare (strain TC 32-1) TaxID=747525 RepID=W4JME2_HETIT|nr:uncharacterized protein HETIRDRAFT_331884 [Heterobasidion irregulare TC 32-1]ETW74634.1 hypothetical protein HETIRDRAFT_331884 [Heterobasidion irregulare TC 32-1]
MAQTTVRLSSDVVVLKTGHGLMMMTWKPTPVSDGEAFEAIKAGLDSLPSGVKMLINSGEFYGIDPPTANLELIARFFEKYPTYTDKVFLSVKGASKIPEVGIDCSPENLERSVNRILDKLRGTKKLDLFECARVDPNYAIEDTIKVLSSFITKGKFDYIGLSECRAETVQRASAIAPISAVEIEVSPWSYTQETIDVIAMCKGLSICSPLGRGFLTGKIRRPDDFEGALRSRQEEHNDCTIIPCVGRISRASCYPSSRNKKRTLENLKGGDIKLSAEDLEENMKHNFAIVDGLKAIADKKGITTAQLRITWVSSLGPHVFPLPGSSKKCTLENLNGGDIELSSVELREINQVLETHTVKGGRYVDEIGDDKLLLRR